DRSQEKVERGAVSANAFDPVVVTRGLTKRYRSRTVVDALDMQIPAGVVAGFIGPNGAGKTTTLRMLLGLVRPSAGGGQVFGRPLQAPARYLPRVGALIESPAFYPGLSGERNLAVQAALGGHSFTRVPVVLERVGLGDRGGDPYRSYSLGMKQRLGIAGALLGDPTLLILDEPTNGLDPAGIRDMRSLVRSLAEDGPTVLVSSHLLAEVQQVCDWLVVIEHGRRVFQGPTAQLLAGHDELTLACENLADLPRLEALVARYGLVATVSSGRLHVALADAPALDTPDGLTRLLGEINRAAMAEQVTLVELSVTRASLENRYLALTAEPATEGAR
ncbi:MAG TPA: ATP-binding cassette domain-containing protein, partial [Dermatophilaceae bacterium]